MRSTTIGFIRPSACGAFNMKPVAHMPRSSNDVGPDNAATHVYALKAQVVRIDLGLDRDDDSS